MCMVMLDPDKQANSHALPGQLHIEMTDNWDAGHMRLQQALIRNNNS